MFASPHWAAQEGIPGVAEWEVGLASTFATTEYPPFWAVRPDTEALMSAPAK